MEKISEVMFNRILLEKTRIAIAVRFPDFGLFDMSLDERTDLVADALFYQLSLFVAAKEHKEILSAVFYPTTWWDALKKRLSNKIPFLKKWIKVKYTKIPTRTKITRICPHLDSSKNKSHLEFLINGKIQYNKLEISK